MAAIAFNDDDPGANLDLDASATGWFLIDGRLTFTSGNNEWRAALLYRIADGTEGANFTFNLDPDTDGGTGVVTGYFGVDITGGVKEDGTPGGPFDFDPGTINLAIGTTLSAPSLATVHDDAELMLFGFVSAATSIVDNSWGASSTSSPHNLFELFDINTLNGADNTVACAINRRTVSGFTGNGYATINSGTPVASGAILIALKAIPIVPSVPLGCDGSFYTNYNLSINSYSTSFINRVSFTADGVIETPLTVNPTGITHNAMGLNPGTGYIYALRLDPNLRQIMIGDYVPSGNLYPASPISHAQISPADDALAGCYDANNSYYFITTANKLFRLFGPLTFIGTVAPASGNFIDIAIDPTDGQMYGTAGSAVGTKHLYKIDKTDGTLTLAGTYTGPTFIAGLFFDEMGNLYGYRSDGAYLYIDKTTAALTQIGTGRGYVNGDACSCPFERVYHSLDYAATPDNTICPSVADPHPQFPLTVSVTNQSGAQRTGLTYTLNIGDPGKRFRFTESAATIKSNLVTAGLASVASVVTLTAEAPATGTDYNKLVVTDFQSGLHTEIKSFPIQVQLYSLGGIYDNVLLQSTITGLPAAIGPGDLSNDPGTLAPDDPTIINFCPNITLPVEFSSFTAIRDRSNVLLKWETATERNNSGFSIERNINNTWTPLAWVPSQAINGNSDAALIYYYTDVNTNKGISQYRIRQVDIDTRSKYSVIRTVRGEGQTGKTIVYPNPSDDGTINIVFDDAAISRDVSIIDMSGRLVRWVRGIRTNSITIERLEAGIYTIKIIAPSTGEQVTEKIIVNKK